MAVGQSSTPAYEIWWKKNYDGRAPEMAFLDQDYDWAGELPATSLKDLMIRVATTTAEDSGLEGHRQLRTGDVVRDPTMRFWIFTPVGVWASVKAFDSADSA